MFDLIFSEKLHLQEHFCHTTSISTASLWAPLKMARHLTLMFPKQIFIILKTISFERNAVIINSNTIDYNILIKRAGGWRTDSYNEFYIDNDDTSDQLPSFHFDRFMNAVFNDSIDQLSPDEQVLALCLNFSYSIMDDIQEVSGSIPLISTTKHRLLPQKSVFF